MFGAGALVCVAAFLITLADGEPIVTILFVLVSARASPPFR